MATYPVTDHRKRPKAWSILVVPYPQLVWFTPQNPYQPTLSPTARRFYSQNIAKNTEYTPSVAKYGELHRSNHGKGTEVAGYGQGT